MRLIEFKISMPTNACDQKNQREHVNSRVAPPHDCHAVEEESVPNKYLDQIQTDTDEVCDICKAIEGEGRAVTRIALLCKCPGDSDPAHRKVLKVTAESTTSLVAYDTRGLHTAVAMVHITIAVAIMTRCTSVLGMLRRSRTAIVRVKRTKYMPDERFNISKE